MNEWYINKDWNQEIEDNFEFKLKRARGGYHKAQYLRIQASHLLDTTDFGEVGVNLMKRLFNDFPTEDFSVIFGHELLGDYYVKTNQFDSAESEYRIVVDYYHSNTRSGTTGTADIKLADLILSTNQSQKFEYAYNLIVEDFMNTDGSLDINDIIYFYALTRSRLAWRLGNKDDSRDFANIALDLSRVDVPQFPRHKTFGLVKANVDEISELEQYII